MKTTIRSKYITLKRLLVGLILLYIAVASLGYLFLDSSLFDEMTLLLCACTGFALVTAIMTSSKYLFDELLMIAIWMILFAFPRVAMYLFAPEETIFPFGEINSVDTVNAGLLYVSAGTLFMLIGMSVSDKLVGTRNSSIPVSTRDLTLYSNKNLLLVFLLVLGTNLYSSFVMGISPYGKMQAESYNTLFQLIKTSLELDSCFYYVLTALLVKHTISTEKGIIPSIFVIICYVLVTVSSGSRSAVMRVVIIFPVIIAILNTRPQIDLVKFVNASLVAICLALAAFPIATLNRARIFASHYDSTAILDAAKEVSVREGVGGLVAGAFNRMGTIDYPILIVTQEGDKEAKEKYLNISYPIKNIINMLLPGTPFPESAIMTSRSVDVIYRGGAETDMYERYFSEFWTLWGISYVYFGWLGGIISMFLFGFVSHVLYMMIVKNFHGWLQIYLRLWFVVYLTGGIVGNMGIDSAFTTGFFGLIQFSALTLCIYLINALSGFFRGFCTQICKAQREAISARS
ncbi:MAG: O-antigen polysaccharide polymerase Wzy [Desulfobacteraceae bacterium]|nr:MAG: O-antigen polysaccharide polymerase Wzy [Desulfobacteraceae bacterium]